MMQTNKLTSSCVLLVALLLIDNVVCSDYLWWTPTSSSMRRQPLRNNGQQKSRWKRNEDAIPTQLQAQTSKVVMDNNAPNNESTDIAPNVNATKAKRKFGLAWLFSFDEDEDKENKNTAKAVDIDERIRGTWLTLEASKKERRVEATTREFSRWHPITWPDEEDDNCTTSPQLPEAYEASKDHTTPITHHDDDQETKLEAMSEDTVKLKCSFYNVHHEIDMDRFSVEWIATKYHGRKNGDVKKDGGEKLTCPEKIRNAPKLILADKPKCRVSTDFPFDDLTTSIKNISCSSYLTFENVTINDTYIYTCRAKIAFTPIAKTSEEKDQPLTEESMKESNENESFTSNYEMSATVMVRVSRRNDYYVHKIVSLVIGSVVIITLLLLVGKKVLGHKLGWENREACNYAPEWPNSVPARRIADAGSISNLSLHHSRSTLRRPSEPMITEEKEEDSEHSRILRHPKYFRSQSEESLGSKDEHEDIEEDAEGSNDEMNEFLRKVRSHGSFKFVLGDDSPKPTTKNPIHRVFSS